MRNELRYAGDGTRTHTTLRSPSSKGGASTSFATPASGSGVIIRDNDRELEAPSAIIRQGYAVEAFGSLACAVSITENDIEDSMATQRVALFVDGANMFYAQRDQKWHIDYRLVYQLVMDNREKAGAYYFVASPSPSNNEKLISYRKFRTALINMGYQVVDKEVRVMTDPITKVQTLKGNLDIDMVFAILTSMNLYDEAVLMGGDSDFIPIIRHLRNSGKSVTVYGRRASTATDVINAASKFIDLEDIRKRIEKGK